jgi:hypothetical protein
MQGYQPGEKGVVLRELLREMLVGISGTRYYLVAMDQDDPSKMGVVFLADEIEPDV